MDIQKIKELALANGFKLKEQASGNLDLNAYVYDFANAIEREAKAQAVPEYAEFYLGGGVFAICDWKDYETVKTSNGILVAVNLELNGYGLMTLKMQT